jgi:hypothetical protein
MTTERRTDQNERFNRIEEKIDKLASRVCIHEDHHDYIAKAMAREARKEEFREAVIQKTTISLIWSFLVGVGYLIWQGVTSHWKW